MVRIVFVGNFSLRHKQTMALRALPLAQQLAARGHAIEIVLPPWDSLEDSGGRANLEGVEIVHVVAPKQLSSLGHLTLAMRVASAAWHFRPDVLYAFKPKAYAGLTLLAFWLLHLVGLFRGRLVLDTDDWEGDGGWNDLERERFTGWQRRFIAWHERWCLRHADAVTVASRELERLATAHGARNVHYVPNAVSDRLPGWRPGTGEVVREMHGLGDRPVVLLYTRFFEYDIGRVVATFASIHAANPRVMLLVVGTGLRGEEHTFARLVGEGGLGDAVVLTGWVSADRLPDYFAAADIALYPLDDTLLNRTKCPMKLVDLLLAGVPTVADSVGQAVEYIRDGETGVLVAPGDGEEMAEAALALLTAPERRVTIGHRAREEMPRRFNWATMVEPVEDVLLGRYRHKR